MNEYQELWNSILDRLSSSLNPTTFEDTFNNAKEVAKVENGVIYITTPSQYIKHKINDLYYNSISNLLGELTTKNLKIKFVLESELKPIRQSENVSKLAINNLNPNYTFESFVVGESNRVSFITATKVAEMPGKLYNPLYIFGGVGLGKTHLMQAIGNYIGTYNINSKILYVQANDYLTDYIKATRDNNMKEFEEKYENIDVLLVDDIQMLTEKNGTQQQFFKLFNDMTNNKKQIIITSDKSADKLNGFMDRLTSRFQMGITVNVNQPDMNQRVEILKRKAEELTQIEVPIDILEYIAENFTDNVRELEGALNRVLLYSEVVYDNKPTIQAAHEALEVLLKTKKATVKDNYDDLFSIIADLYNISVADLLGNSRASKYVTPRHIAMYLLKKKYGLTYNKIGILLNGRDHTTIMNGFKSIETEINSNEELKMAVETISKKI